MKRRISHFYLDCLNDSVEGEHQVHAIVPLILNKKKLSLNIFLTIISIGIWAIFLYWSPTILKDSLFDLSEVHVCTHFYVVLNSK